MEERFIEIRFYYYILKLLAKFKYSIHVLDIVESYCAIGGIDARVIKNLLKQVKEHNSIIDTYKEEAVCVGRELGISYRTLEKLLGIPRSTQSRLQNYYKNHPGMYKGITGHLSKEQYEEVYKFMKIVDIIKEL